MKRTFIAIIITAALAFGLASCSYAIQPSGSGTCTLTEARTATISAENAIGANIKNVNGQVKVIGRPGLKEVKVSGTACASNEADLKKVKLTTEHSSDGWVRVIAELPSGRGNHRLDLTVEVPDDLQVIARNDNGAIEVSHIYRGANVRGDNGTLTVTDIKGGATVESRNGAVTIKDVEGDVNVTRADNGILVVTDVKGNVTLSKKAGAVTVINVTGDLTVRDKVKGLVSHTGIGGKVSVPQ